MQHVEPENGDCQFLPVKCSNGCGLSLLCTEIDKHLKIYCPNRQYVCEFDDCGMVEAYKVIFKNHMPGCKHRPIECPNNCMIGTIKQGLLEKHLKTCRFLQIDCEIPGCDGKFTRDDTQRHKDKNFSSHIDLLASSIQNVGENFHLQQSDLQRQVNEWGRENAVLKKQLVQTEIELNKENTALKTEILQCQIHIKRLCETVAKLEHTTHHLLSQQVKLSAGEGPSLIFSPFQISVLEKCTILPG